MALASDVLKVPGNWPQLAAVVFPAFCVCEILLGSLIDKPLLRWNVLIDRRGAVSTTGLCLASVSWGGTSTQISVGRSDSASVDAEEVSCLPMVSSLAMADSHRDSTSATVVRWKSEDIVSRLLDRANKAVSNDDWRCRRSR